MISISMQLIVTSSALIEDLYKAIIKSDAKDKTYVLLGRISVLFVSLIALGFAWGKTDTILKLVSFAWAGFGASFGPIILLTLYWRKDRKSTRLNSSHVSISYAVFCLKKKI